MDQLKTELVDGQVTFDTHRFVRHLTENGFSEQKAEALAQEQVRLFNKNLATKSDFQTFHTNIHAEIEKLGKEASAEVEKVRLELKTDISTSHTTLLKWIGSGATALGGLTVALFWLS